AESEHSAGAGPVHEVRGDPAAGFLLDRDRQRPAPGAPASGGGEAIEYVRQCRTPSISTPTGRYCRGLGPYRAR
ncbi:hypothetical protein, partial [Streptomyces sp. NPDC050564]|uniref:hypothetical protein n=1 Tax=Streptomyces sp. NPDC050564 TaxID=3365631 RepID=UPI0037A94CEA